MKNKFFEGFVPFLVAGFSIAIAIGLFFVIFQVFIWGLVFAAILWLTVTVKNLIMAKLYPPAEKKSKHQGITIDHDDL